MVRVGELIQTRIKFKDFFHLKNLYVMMHEWLLEESWLGENMLPDHSDIEKLYLENMYQKGVHYGGKEMWVLWRLQKNPEGKKHGYFINKMNVDFHLMFGRDHEIVHQGKKLKVQWGELEIFVKAYVDSDYKKDWEKHFFLKRINELFRRRALSEEIEKREKELYRETQRFVAAVKRFLNLRNFIPTPEPFHTPLYGYEDEAPGRIPVR